MVTFWLTPNTPFGMGPEYGSLPWKVPTHGAGHHHRHEWIDGEEQVTKLEFEDLDSHLADFETEVIAYDR